MVFKVLIRAMFLLSFSSWKEGYLMCEVGYSSILISHKENDRRQIKNKQT